MKCLHPIPALSAYLTTVCLLSTVAHAQYVPIQQTSGPIYQLSRLPDPAYEYTAWRQVKPPEDYPKVELGEDDPSVVQPFSMGCDTRCKPCCGNVCCCKPRWIFGAEATFLKYYRSDGARVGTSGPTEAVNFDFNPSPRITLGYASCCWGGFRARWWDYDQFAPAAAAGQGMDVETVVWDFEWFDRIYANNRWTVGISAGVRYHEFLERMVNGGGEIRVNDFDGWGGIFGLEVTRAMPIGALYANARGGILVGNKFVRNDNNAGGGGPLTRNINDVVVGAAEIGMGYQLSFNVLQDSLFVFRSGVEWQKWFDYTSHFVDSVGGTGTDEDFSGPSDVGFAGFTVSASLYY